MEQSFNLQTTSDNTLTGKLCGSVVNILEEMDILVYWDSTADHDICLSLVLHVQVCLIGRYLPMASREPVLPNAGEIQLSVIITQFNITRYCIHHCSDGARI